MKKFLTAFFIYTTCFANEPLKPTRISTAPTIDGKLDEIFWQNILQVTDFKTFYPDFKKDASQKTIAYAAYDSDNLYFAFRCYDTEPDKIKTSVSTRDNIRPDDWICINLDTFNDQQSLYAFYVNPNGIQTDSRYSAGIEDFSADFVWYSAGELLPDGYTVEIAIPLKSLRYSDSNPVTMSIFFERYISRLSEHSSFPELDPAMGMAFLVQMKPLEYYNIEHYTLFELLPALTYTNKYLRKENELVKDENKGEISLTAKYGITSDLIIDATYNPDFSQVEADAGQVDVNLRYALYYPEKRPFFLEGSEIFNIASTSTSEVDPLGSLVHTRNIVNPLTGIKLSGKIGTKNTLAVLYALDEETNLSSEKINSHFPIIRYKRTLADDSYIGGIYTGKEMKDNYNRAVGIDGIVRLTQSSTVDWNGIYSTSKFLGYDEKKDGSALSLRYNYDTRDLFYGFTFKDISEFFNVETGYITRTGIMALTGLIRPKFYPEDSFISRIDLEAFSAQQKDKPSSQWETYNYLSAQAFYSGTFNTKVKYVYSTEIFNNNKFKTGGFSISLGGLINTQFSFSLLYRSMNTIYYSETPYQGNGNTVSAIFVFKPTPNIESYSTFVFSNFYRSSDEELIYEYPIFREKLTYQLNKYLFFRGIVEYNKFKRQLITDFLISFTYVPGTVLHFGYGSLYQRTEWDELENRYIDVKSFKETVRGFFFKMSYLWRI